MVIVAIAQTMAFTYTDYMDERTFTSNPSNRNPMRPNQNFFANLFRIVFASRDVIDDARNTFIKDMEDERECETALDTMTRKAFNWSDEELLTPELEKLEKEKRMYKDKYGKKKQTKMQKALIYKQNVQNALSNSKTKQHDNRYKKLKGGSDKSTDKLKSDANGTYGAMETQLQTLPPRDEEKLQKPRSDDVDDLEVF